MDRWFTWRNVWRVLVVLLWLRVTPYPVLYLTADPGNVTLWLWLGGYTAAAVAAWYLPLAVGRFQDREPKDDGLRQ